MQDNRKNNFRRSTGLYSKLTYRALERKPRNWWKNSLQEAASSAPEESNPKDLGSKIPRTLEISVITTFIQDFSTVGHHHVVH